MRWVPPIGPELRDIHVPVASWWPPAWGWWLSATLILILLVLAVRWLRGARRRRRVHRKVAAELERIAAEFAVSQDHATLAAAVSALLRRAVLARGGGAHLHGAAWQAEVERLAPGRMDVATLALLQRAPYQRQVEFDAEALLRGCADWLQTALGDRHA